MCKHACTHVFVQSHICAHSTCMSADTIPQICVYTCANVCMHIWYEHVIVHKCVHLCAYVWKICVLFHVSECAHACVHVYVFGSYILTVEDIGILRKVVL